MWMQMRADLFDLPVAVPEVEEAGTLGAAIMAGAACGVYRDVADGVKRLVRIRRTYTPDPVRHEQYMEIFERYRRMYRCVKQIMGRNEE
jgi:sugar (pentulose or hexulose) kinase